MNKEQLINLRNMLFGLESEEEYLEVMRDSDNYYLLSSVIKKAQIQNALDTEGAAQAIMSNFESLIHYCYNKQISFDTITITPHMCPYVKKKSLDKYFEYEENDCYVTDDCESSIILKDDIELLDDIVTINLYRFFISNNKKIVSRDMDPEYIPNYNATKNYVISLTDLKNKLLKEGLVLKGVEEVRDVLTNNYKGSITIEFEPKKNKSKVLKNK